MSVLMDSVLAEQLRTFAALAKGYYLIHSTHMNHNLLEMQFQEIQKPLLTHIHIVKHSYT